MRQSLRINQYIFQSTLSVRRATSHIQFVQLPVRISIHALREESDPCSATKPFSIMIFQSTLSVRRATRIERRERWRARFQSTLSVRRATLVDKLMRGVLKISIHALREESDSASCSCS